MARTFRLLFLFLGASLLLAGCGKGGKTVKIERTNFEGEVDQQQNLVFTFNREVVPESRVGVWDTTQYLILEPPTPGRFKWTKTNELMFSPLNGFQASADYKVKLSDQLLDLGVEDAITGISNEEITFHTPYLDIIGASTFWDKDNRGNAQARVRLQFNHAINPGELSGLLSVKMDGKEVTYNVTSQQKTREVDLVVVPGKIKGSDNLTLSFEVKPGLACAESDWKTKDPLKYVAEFPAANLLAITSVETESDGEKGSVFIYTTQALPASGLAQYISVSPEVSYTVQATDNGVRLQGSFEAGSTYTLKVSRSLTGVLGSKLEQDYEQTFAFDAAGEIIAFMHPKGQYLPGAGSQSLGIRINGVDKVHVRVLKVYENNLISFFRSSRYDYNYDYEYDSETGDYYSWRYYDVSSVGDVIVDETFEVNSLPRTQGGRLLDLNYLAKRRDYAGIYVVEVFAENKLWIRDSKVLSVSDIGLIARHGKNDIWVFANSIRTAQPISGLEVNLVSTNNQQVYTATTDADGLAVFKDLGTKAPDFRVTMVTAHQGTDFNYLYFPESGVETSRFEVGGKFTSDRTYDAFIYGDRDLYRPGDSVHVNSIVRTFEWDMVGDMPVTLTVTLPTGREMTTLRGTLDDQGAFATSFHLPAATPTGPYTLRLETADKQYLGSRTVMVEEFIPDRIKVQLDLASQKLTPGQDLTTNLTATNLFGPPASFRNYEVEVSMERAGFYPKGYDNFNFWTEGGETSFETIYRTGQTDAEGKAQEVFKEFESYTNIGLLRGRVFTAVFDETGRPVNRLSTFEVFTQKVFYGIGQFDHYASTNQPLDIPLIALDYNGKAQSGIKARVEIVKVEYETVLEKTYNGYRYVSQERERTMVNRQVDLNGEKNSFRFSPTLSGTYQIRVYKPGSKAFVRSYFYAWGWGTTQATSFEVSTEGTVLVESNKEAYTKGETAEILFKTPFDGRLLVTYERDGLLAHTYIETENRAAKLDLRLSDAHVPNVYVSATLIRPVDGSSPVPLTVAHGYLSLKVDDTADKLPLTITAAEKSTSRRKQTITLKTKPGARVTLAVVDEGILQIRNTETPDPYGYFYAKRGLEVGAYDLYAELLPEMRANFKRSSTGAGGMDEERRVNPLTNKRVKLVSFWSGVKKADGSGNVSFTVDIPQFSGSLRVMAVAYKDKAFGSAEQNMVVADPVVVSTAMPRFLSPGDELEVPVTLTNTTKKDASAQVTLTVSGPLKAKGSTKQSVNLPANQEGRVSFKLVANQAIGEAKVSVTVTALGGTYSEDIDITVRPPSSLVKLNGAGNVSGGQSASINLNASDFLPASRQGKLIVSRSPLVQFSKNLDYLLGYPYGCIEQTISKAFPQLYYADLVKAMRQKRYLSADYDIREAIAKVQSMQLYGGGISYWPGGSEANWWGTAYAAHFLYEAKKAGYEVDSKVLKNALSYLKKQRNNRETTRYYVGDNTYRTYANREIFYSLFVLALTGEQEVSAMNYYKSRPELMTEDSRYLLAAAYALIGDRGAYRSLLPSGFDAQELPRQTGGSFASPIRDRAIALYTLLEVDPKNAQVGTLVRNLSELMKGERWLSTQEAVFGFMALGRFARLSAQSTATGSVMVAGKTLGKVGKEDLVITEGVAGQQVSLKTEGEGELYYFWETSGISATGTIAQEDSRIRVRRTYYTRTGSVWGEPEFEQNDLVIVKLSVQAIEKETIENVSITDLLPAGLEIENMRLTSLPELNWIKNQSQPEYLDIRDDRILFFDDVDGYERNYYYIVRAVSPGTFRQGPASADAMYDGTIHSYFGAQTVTVSPKKKPSAQ